MKRIPLLLCLFLVLLLLLAGCGERVPDGAPADGASEVGDAQESAGDQTLAISVCYNFNAASLEAAAEAFREVRPDVTVEIKNYESDVAAYQQQVSAQLLSGTASDIVDATGYSEIAMSDSGLLADIYPFMEKDPNFDPNDYFMSVFDGMSYGGKLVVFPVCYIYDFVGVNVGFSPELTEAYNKLETVSLQELLALYKAQPDKKGLYPCYIMDGALIVDQNMRSFVDFSNKRCSFDTPEFLQFLEDTKDAVDPEKVAKGELGYSRMGPYTQEEVDEEALRYLFTLGGKEQLIPYLEEMRFSHYIPLTNEKGKLIIMPMERFCINAASAKQDLAWEFLRFLTTPEANENTFLYAFPVHRGLFESYVNQEVAGLVEYSATPEALAEGNEVLVERIVNQLRQCSEMPMEYQFNLGQEELIDLVRETLGGYYSGFATAEEAAKALQERISIYLME